ncbi:hypothetical protein [Marinobacter arenosus]|uniref:hypothetical protein n=1 Tax=Marinobacter arenosus TaxID=2856822 RepID=UPI001C4CD757|nr:hypothetical protein [Marinobacter arenosus]MBW0147161.1 hypothetical protein [Marinobacter arenosus]
MRPPSPKILSALLVLAAAGCSNKAVYDNLRLHQRQECLNAPPPTQAECIERTEQSFEDYERARKEAEEAP